MFVRAGDVLRPPLLVYTDVESDYMKIAEAYLIPSGV